MFVCFVFYEQVILAILNKHPRFYKKLDLTLDIEETVNNKKDQLENHANEMSISFSEVKKAVEMEPNYQTYAELNINFHL